MYATFRKSREIFDVAKQITWCHERNYSKQSVPENQICRLVRRSFVDFSIWREWPTRHLAACLRPAKSPFTPKIVYESPRCVIIYVRYILQKQGNFRCGQTNHMMSREKLQQTECPRKPNSSACLSLVCWFFPLEGMTNNFFSTFGCMPMTEFFGIGPSSS